MSVNEKSVDGCISGLFGLVIVCVILFVSCVEPQPCVLAETRSLGKLQGVDILPRHENWYSTIVVKCERGSFTTSTGNWVPPYWPVGEEVKVLMYEDGRCSYVWGDSNRPLK